MSGKGSTLGVTDAKATVPSARGEEGNGPCAPPPKPQPENQEGQGLPPKLLKSSVMVSLNRPKRMGKDD